MATVRIIDTCDGFLALKECWSSLFSKNQKLRAFQTFEWMYDGWLEYHNKIVPTDRLLILYAKRDGHEEEAIFPFCMGRDGYVKFIMHMLSDVSDVICCEHDTNWHVFYKDVLSFLLEIPGVKGLCLGKLECDSELATYWGVSAPECAIRYADSYSYLDLSRSCNLSDALKHLPSKDRSYLRSQIKKCGHLEYRVYSAGRGDVYPRSEIEKLRCFMLGIGLRVEASIPKEMFGFIEKFYSSGMVDVVTYRGSDGFEEAAYALKNGRHINFWVVLYKDSHLVTSANAQYIEGEINEGDRFFDFGTGVYSYKLGTFRPQIRHLVYLESKPKTFSNFIKDFFELMRVNVKVWIGPRFASKVSCIKRAVICWK